MLAYRSRRYRMTTMEKLNAGEQFPTMTLDVVNGDRIVVPADFSNPYQVLLFYRGHW